MSGHLRRRLGPQKSRLRTKIDQSTSLLDAKSRWSTIDLLSAKHGLVLAKDTITSTVEEWESLIQNTTDDDAEVHLFMDTVMPIHSLIFEADDLLALIEAHLAELQQRQAPSSTLATAPPQAPPNPIPSTTTTPARSVSLPKLKLPLFNGDCTAWREFWDIFDEAVNTQPLADTAKFSYLLSSLTGEAKKAVAGLSLSTANYKVAVDILRKKYAREDVLTNTLYRQLRALPVAAQNLTSIRNTVDSIEKILRQLEGLGQDIDGQHLVIQQLQEKFPLGMLEKLEESRDDDPWTVQTLRKAIARYVEVKERAERAYALSAPTTPTGTTNGTTGSYGSSRHDHDQAMSGVLSAGTTTSVSRSSQNSKIHTSRPSVNSKSMSPCAFCGGNHLHRLCAQYTSPNTRKDRLLQSRRCFVCLKKGHCGADCPAFDTRTCKNCKSAGHHHLICSQTNPSAGSTSRSRAQASLVIAANPDPEPCPVSHGTTPASDEPDPCIANVTTAAATSPRLVMLQTATVSVRSPTSKNGHSVRARVLLDGGAQRTFITRSLAEDLSLPLQTGEQLSVATFGTSDPTITSSATCEFSLDFERWHLVPDFWKCTSQAHPPDPSRCGTCQRHGRLTIYVSILLCRLDSNGA